MDPATDKLDRLLDEWETARANGVHCTAEDLADGDDELCRQLGIRIRSLLAFERFDASQAEDVDEDNELVGRYRTRHGEIRFFERGIGLRDDLSRKLEACPLAMKFRSDRDIVVLKADHRCERWHASYFDTTSSLPLKTKSTVVSAAVDQGGKRIMASFENDRFEIWDANNNSSKDFAFGRTSCVDVINASDQYIAGHGANVSVFDASETQKPGVVFFDRNPILDVATDSHATAIAFATKDRIFLQLIRPQTQHGSYEVPSRREPSTSLGARIFYASSTHPAG